MLARLGLGTTNKFLFATTVIDVAPRPRTGF